VSDADAVQLTDIVRDECIARLLGAVEDAAIRGVCAEGQLEAAISELRRQDAAELLRAARARGHTDV
jgi:hypothetical protein